MGHLAPLNDGESHQNLAGAELLSLNPYNLSICTCSRHIPSYTPNVVGFLRSLLQKALSSTPYNVTAAQKHLHSQRLILKILFWGFVWVYLGFFRV